MAFEQLTPLPAHARLSRGVGRPVRHVHGPIPIDVDIPRGHREHLEIPQDTLGAPRAPDFGPPLEHPREGRGVWEGSRGPEEYAREVFPIEEYAHGSRWTDEGGRDVADPSSSSGPGDGADEMARSRPLPPAHAAAAGSAITPPHISGAHTPRSHPEGVREGFHVGSI